jgi:hypothetical protein
VDFVTPDPDDPATLPRNYVSLDAIIKGVDASDDSGASVDANAMVTDSDVTGFFHRHGTSKSVDLLYLSSAVQRGRKDLQDPAVAYRPFAALSPYITDNSSYNMLASLESILKLRTNLSVQMDQPIDQRLPDAQHWSDALLRTLWAGGDFVSAEGRSAELYLQYDKLVADARNRLTATSPASGGNADGGDADEAQHDPMEVDETAAAPTSPVKVSDWTLEPEPATTTAHQLFAERQRKRKTDKQKRAQKKKEEKANAEEGGGVPAAGAAQAADEPSNPV